jgi:SAM-dependent methyltransferase
MNIQNSHMPPQATRLVTGPAKVKTYESTGGEVTAQFAQHLLTLLPANNPITPTSIVHDNACGSGTISRAILSTSPSVKVHATDIDQPFLDALSADAQKNNWPVEVSNQKSEKLDFADATFTHSFTNIALFFFSDAGLDGAKEIHRTLQPGGTAVVNCWKHVTWLFPILAVHKHFRPSQPFSPPTTNWADGKQIVKVMTEAGFAQEKIRIESHEVWTVVEGGDAGFREWCEKSWAYLGGIAGWVETDEGVWAEEVNMLMKVLKGLPEEKGVKVEGDVVRLRAEQWLVVAEK